MTAASDAFGTVVGSQTIGLYSPTSARGFNPTQAGNLRIEGMYFDQQTQSANPYLFIGSDMRVGMAAQSYAFPSPSGIADFKLRIPARDAGASVVVIRGPLDLLSAEVDTRYPLVADSLSVGLNVGYEQDFDYVYALSSRRRAISVLARIEPSPRTEIVPFFGYIENSERRETPYVFADRQHPVPFFQEQDLPTQNWTTWDWNQVTAGVLAKFETGGHWKLRGGVFRSIDEDATNFNDLLLGLLPNGTSSHVMDVPPAHRSSSYSGDLRAVWSAIDKTHRRELTFAIRGRQVDRDYGGDSITDLGTTSIHLFPVIPEPALTFSAKSRDIVRQSGIGINYYERWKDVGSINLGLLRTGYSRDITSAATPTVAQNLSRLLPTASFTIDVVKAATVYGSYTRGLEDSVVAPVTAANRGELPPTTPTWQADGGVRVALRPDMQLLLGAFTVHKTYFGLDASNIYTQIGEISSTGIESSFHVATANGLTVVAGAVWLRPSVKRMVPELGGGGPVPVGPVPRTINVNVDFAPPNWSGWATSLQWTSLSSRVETADDNYRLEPLATLNVGLRYGFKVHDRACSVRFDAANVTNAAGVTIAPVYLLGPQLERNFALTLTIDL